MNDLNQNIGYVHLAEDQRLIDRKIIFVYTQKDAKIMEKLFQEISATNAELIREMDDEFIFLYKGYFVTLYKGTVQFALSNKVEEINEGSFLFRGNAKDLSTINLVIDCQPNKNRPAFYEVYLSENPSIFQKSDNEILLRADRLNMRFLITGGSLCIFGDYGMGYYVQTNTTWEKLKDFAKTPFEHFVEKCRASTYGIRWADGQRYVDHDGDNQYGEPHAFAWMQYLSLRKMLELKAISDEKINLNSWLWQNGDAMSGRLYSSLSSQSIIRKEFKGLPKIEFLEDVTKERFFAIRNLGEKTWLEFSLLRSVTKIGESVSIFNADKGKEGKQVTVSFYKDR